MLLSHANLSIKASLTSRMLKWQRGRDREKAEIQKHIGPLHYQGRTRPAYAAHVRVICRISSQGCFGTSTSNPNICEGTCFNREYSPKGMHNQFDHSHLFNAVVIELKFRWVIIRSIHLLWSDIMQIWYALFSILAKDL